MREILITNGSNPQPEVRKNAETARDWQYHEEAETLYNMAVLIRDRLIDPVLRLDRSQVPDPVISFDNLRQSRTLACYRLNRNPQGLLHEVTFNTAHYETVDGKQVWRFGRWAQLETLTHEYLHLKQQKYGLDPYKGRGGGHNAEFVRMGREIGLNIFPVVGCHYAVADEGSPFALLMHELGIQRPDDVPSIKGGDKPKDDWFEIGRKRKGRSSLTKWSCECGQNAWIGSAEFHAICAKCLNPFIPAETKAQAVLGMTLQPPEVDTTPTTPETEPDPTWYQEEAEKYDMDDWEDLSTYMDMYTPE
jgi:hypothetical protein